MADGDRSATTDEDLPTAAEAIARCGETFDATDTERLPNATDCWNEYAGSSHGGG